MSVRHLLVVIAIAVTPSMLSQPRVFAVDECGPITDKPMVIPAGAGRGGLTGTATAQASATPVTPSSLQVGTRLPPQRSPTAVAEFAGAEVVPLDGNAPPSRDPAIIDDTDSSLGIGNGPSASLNVLALPF